MLQIGSAEQYAQAGDVILSPEVAAVAAGHCTVDPLESNNSRLVSMSEQAVVSAFVPLPAGLHRTALSWPECSYQFVLLSSLSILHLLALLSMSLLTLLRHCCQ